jgi:ubiquinone biosynthesis protein COQ4
MMPLLATSPNITPRLQKVLDLLDRQAEAKGLAVPQIVEIEKLRSLSTGTFGRAWADLLDANNLQPFTTGSRRKQLHDGIHVLTGYRTDLIGEAQVQAFVLGTKFRLTNVMLGLGLLRVIYKHQSYRQQFSWDRLWQVYQRGVHSRFNPDTWQPELLWNLSVTDVQALFSVVKSKELTVNG